ncbi:TPA: hypothetical protein ACMDT2_003257 [Vibrio parahaemolyticus]
MDYILGVFPQLGYVVKKVSKRLYRLVKFKKRQPLKAVLFSFTSKLKGRQQRLIKKLPFYPQRSHRCIFSPEPFQEPSEHVLAWGQRVSPVFKSKVVEICSELEINPNHLMACMAFETAETFSPSIRNGSGSGATGLIQFMPATAKNLGTSTKHLAMMSAVEQLDYVKAYFWPYRHRMSSLEDVYMAILHPAAIGKSPSHVLFKQGSIAYRQNAGIDRHSKGSITLSDVSYKVRQKLAKGLQPNFMG